MVPARSRSRSRPQTVSRADISFQSAVDESGRKFESEMSEESPNHDKIHVKYRKIHPSDLKLLNFFAQGVYTDIHKATWQEKSVAVKMSSTVDKKGGVSEELMWLSKLHDHANIVTLYGAHLGDSQTDRPFIVMEFAPYTLEKVLHHCHREIEYTVDHMMSWTVQMARALEYIHSQNILHRDIKPTNILLFQDGCVLKLCGFRTACKLEHTLTNAVGTSWYMAPEVIRGTHYSTSCDVYSFSVVLWEMITRCRPYLAGTRGKSITPQSVLYRVATGSRLPMIKGLPKCLEELIQRCWDKDFHRRPTFLEIRSKMERLVQLIKIDMGKPFISTETLYEEAMTRGYIESALALLILVGVMGSGKSLFKRLVLGLAVPDFSPSTPLAESSVRSMSICQVAVGDEGPIEWRIVTPRDMMDIVADVIKKGVPVLDLPWKECCELAFMPGTNLPDESNVVSSEGVKEAKNPLPKPADAGVSQPMPESKKYSSEAIPEEPRHESSGAPLSPKCLDALKGINVGQELLKRMSKSSAGMKLMDVNFVYILDSGGQPPFREMLMHFVHESSAFVLMQKLNERLDFKPPVEYREEGKQDSGQYTSQLTNEQILYQYFQAVQSHDARVFVVGTHRDLEHQCQTESRELKNQRLLEAFRPILGNRIILFSSGDPDQLMFPVDCTSRRPEDQATAQAFRERVMKFCLGKKVKIPLPWFMLEQLLRQLAEKMGEKVLSIEECYELAQKLLVPRNCCRAAIDFLGKLNIIFYRPSVLPRVVFCNAQVVLDKITELVKFSHKLKSNTPQSLLEHRQSGEWLNFRDFAQINSKILEEFPSHYRDGLFTSSHFLKLLEDLLIAGKLGNGKHFMPSILPDLSLEEVAQYRVTAAKHPAPITIYYAIKSSEIWLPVGVVPALVVKLQNHHKMRPVLRGGKPACMYHNCIQFELPGRMAGSVTLINSTKFLEIHVKSSLKIASKVCPRIRKMVMSSLKEAHRSLHYDSAVASEGVLCSGECDNAEPHLATLDEDRETWRCSEQADVGDDLDEKRQALWFVPIEDTVKDKIELNLRNLQVLHCCGGKEVRIMDQVAGRWKDLAVPLGFNEVALDIIQNDSFGKSEDACLMMFQKWLTGQVRPVCWNVLLEALRDGKFEELVLKLTEALQH